VQSKTGRMDRLLRFQVTVGSATVSENFLLMPLLVAALGIHYLPANLITITCCALLNYFAIDHLVFRRSIP